MASEQISQNEFIVQGVAEAARFTIQTMAIARPQVKIIQDSRCMEP